MHHVPHTLSIVALLSWSVVGSPVLPLPKERFPSHLSERTTDHIFVNVGLRDDSLRSWPIKEKHAAAYVRILITWADNLVLEEENDWPPVKVCQFENAQADIPPTDALSEACKDIRMKGRDILDINQETSKIITTTCKMTRMKIIIPDNFLDADERAFWGAVHFFKRVIRESRKIVRPLPITKSLKESIKATDIHLIDATRNLDASTFRTIIRAFIASQVYVPVTDALEKHITKGKAIARDGFYHWVKHTYPGTLVQLPPKPKATPIYVPAFDYYFSERSSLNSSPRNTPSPTPLPFPSSSHASSSTARNKDHAIKPSSSISSPLPPHVSTSTQYKRHFAKTRPLPPKPHARDTQRSLRRSRSSVRPLSHIGPYLSSASSSTDSFSQDTPQMNTIHSYSAHSVSFGYGST